MSLPRSRTYLHNLILDYSPSAMDEINNLILLLAKPTDALAKANARALFEPNENGYTALQLAARAGRMDLVVALASVAEVLIDDVGNAHPAKTPLYLAIECGYLLLAEILRAFGANPVLVEVQAKKLGDACVADTLGKTELKRDTLQLLMFQATHHNHREALHRLIPQWYALAAKESKSAEKYSLSRFIELAAAFNKPDVLQKFCEEEKTITTRRDIPNAAYWALENNHSALYERCKKDDDVMSVALYQLDLQNKESLWDKCKTDATPLQRELFIAHCQSPEEQKIKDPLRIRQAAAFKKISYLATVKNAKDQHHLYDALVESFRDQNYVAFKTISSMMNFDKLFDYFLSASKPLPMFLCFWLNFAIGEHPHVFPAYKDTVHLIYTPAALAQHQVNQVVANRKFSEENKNVLSYLEKFEKVSTVQCLLTALSQRFSDEDFTLLQSKRGATLDDRIRELTAANINLKLQTRKLLIEFFDAFGLPHSLVWEEKEEKKLNLNRLPEILLNKVYGYLNADEQKGFSSVSENFHLVHANTLISSKEVKNLSEIKQQLAEELTLMNSFIDLIDGEKAAKNFCSNRRGTFHVSIGGCTLTGLGLAAGLYFAAKLDREWRSLCGDAEGIPYGTYTCRSFTSETAHLNACSHIPGRGTIHDDIQIPSICFPICDALEAVAGKYLLGATLGSLFVGIAFCIFASWCIAEFTCLAKGKERFEKLYIKDYSKRIQDTFHAMKTQCKTERAFWETDSIENIMPSVRTAKAKTEARLGTFTTLVTKQEERKNAQLALAIAPVGGSTVAPPETGKTDGLKHNQVVIVIPDYTPDPAIPVPANIRFIGSKAASAKASSVWNSASGERQPLLPRAPTIQ